jgi:hypothetical protein
MLLNLLPGLRELRAPLAAGYLWLFGAWLAFEGDFPEPAGAAEFFEQFEAVGAAAALTFAAYLLGSFLTDLFGFLWTAVRLFRVGPIFKSPESYPQTVTERRRRRERDLAERFKRLIRREPKSPRQRKRLRERLRERRDRRKHRRLRERLIRIQAAEPLSPEGAAAIDEVSKRAVRRIPEERRKDVDRRLFVDDGYTVRGPGGPRWMVGRRISYEPRELKVTGSDDAGDVLALRVAVALGDELDTARFRLLSEQRDLFHEVDRLSAEGEFRLAVSPALALIAAVLASSESLLWLLTFVPIYLLILLGIARQEQSGDRIIYAIRAGKVKTPILERLDAEAPSHARASGNAASVDDDR